VVALLADGHYRVLIEQTVTGAWGTGARAVVLPTEESDSPPAGRGFV